MSTDLHLAAKNGDIKKIDKLIQGGFLKKPIPVDAKDESNCTPLYVAVLNQQFDAARHLIKTHKANVEVILRQAISRKEFEVATNFVKKCYGGFDFANSMYFAVKRGEYKFVKALIHKCNVEGDLAILRYIIDFCNDDDLQVAKDLIQHCDVSIYSAITPRIVFYDDKKLIKYIEYLIKEFNVDVNASLNNHKAQFILHRCVGLGYVAVVKFLISNYNAQVNLVDSFYGTAFHAAIDMPVESPNATLRRYATYDAQEEMVHFLLEETDIDLTVKNEKGQTAIENAIGTSWHEKLLTHNKKAIIKKLCETAEKGDFEKVKQLTKDVLSLGFSIDEQSDFGTVLHYAVSGGNTDIIQHLIFNCSARTDILDSSGGLAPLHTALVKRGTDLMKFLIERSRVDARIRSSQGWTVLHWAAYINAYDAIPYLVHKRHLDVNQTDSYGNTPLRYAIASVEAFSSLVECGADLACKDGENRTLDELITNDDVKQLYLSLKNKKLGDTLSLGSDEENNNNASTTNTSIGWTSWMSSHVSNYFSWTSVTTEVTPENENIEVKPQLPPSPKAPLKIISHEQLEFGVQIANGGFSIVFKGVWSHTNVAIKQLLNEKLSKKDNEAFEREMTIMANLNHPNIVRLYCAVIEKAPYCLVLEYMDGGSLYDFLHSEEPLPEDKCKKIALDLATGLNYLHAENVLHRDLKSLNVLLDKQGNAKLTDFGLSKITRNESSQLTSTKLVGSWRWMPPESFNNEKYTKKSDIYSLGLVFWELFSRQVPLKECDTPAAIMTQVLQRPEPETIPANCSPKYAKLIRFCWQKKPVDRCDTNDILTLLKDISENDLAKTIPAQDASLNSLQSLYKGAAAVSGYIRSFGI